MGSQARKLSREQEKARHRTQNAKCARCGLGVSLHKDGQCPDGLGSYTWAMTSEDMLAAIRNLEEAQAQVGKVTLTKDEQRVLDLVAERFMRGGANLTPTQLAVALGIPPHYAKALCDSLTKKGMLGRTAQEPS